MRRVIALRSPASARAFDRVNVRRVESLLRQDLGQLELLPNKTTETPVPPLPVHFARSARSFLHHPSNRETGHGGSETLA